MEYCFQDEYEVSINFDALDKLSPVVRARIDMGLLARLTNTPLELLDKYRRDRDELESAYTPSPRDSLRRLSHQSLDKQISLRLQEFNSIESSCNLRRTRTMSDVNNATIAESNTIITMVTKNKKSGKPRPMTFLVDYNEDNSTKEDLQRDLLRVFTLSTTNIKSLSVEEPMKELRRLSVKSDTILRERAKLEEIVKGKAKTDEIVKYGSQMDVRKEEGTMAHKEIRQEEAMADKEVKKEAMADKEPEKEVMADKEAEKEAMADKEVEKEAIGDKEVRQKEAMADKEVEKEAMDDKEVEVRQIEVVVTMESEKEEEAALVCARRSDRVETTQEEESAHIEEVEIRIEDTGNELEMETSFNK